MSEKILVVDDVQQNAMPLAGILAVKGWAVSSVDSGEMACKRSAGASRTWCCSTP